MLVPGAEIFHRGVLQLDDGAHAAVRLAGRLVHQFTAAADKVEAVLQRDGAGIGQCGDLAQGEPGGALAGDGLQRGGRGQLDGEHARLGDVRPGQVLGLGRKALVQRAGAQLLQPV